MTLRFFIEIWIGHIWSGDNTVYRFDIIILAFQHRIFDSISPSLTKPTNIFWVWFGQLHFLVSTSFAVNFWQRKLGNWQRKKGLTEKIGIWQRKLGLTEKNGIDREKWDWQRKKGKTKFSLSTVGFFSVKQKLINLNWIIIILRCTKFVYIHS